MFFCLAILLFIAVVFNPIGLTLTTTSFFLFNNHNADATSVENQLQHQVIDRASGPIIKSFKVSDPDRSDPKFSRGDVLTIKFSPATNQPGASKKLLEKGDIDRMFSFSQSIGSNYTGRWVNPSTFMLSIEEVKGNENPQIRVTTVTVKRDANLTNAAGTSLPSTSTSPPLTGSFGALPGPDIDAIVADGSHASRTENSTDVTSGDTITVRFVESTNKPFEFNENNLTKDNLDDLFLFSQSLGDNYTGRWINPSTLLITITDALDSEAAIGKLNVTVKEEANLTNAAGTSLPSTSTSPPLTGSFGPFSVNIPTKFGGTAITTLPSGIKIGITTLFSSGIITISKTDIGNLTGLNGESLYVIGDVVDVSAQSSTNNTSSCGKGCGFVFVFSDDDLLASNLKPSNVRILHDKNNDNDFNDSGEILKTNIIRSTPPGTYFATARDSFNSKFAIGGIPGEGGTSQTFQ